MATNVGPAPLKGTPEVVAHQPQSITNCLLYMATNVGPAPLKVTPVVVL